jgi:hypothetical protein
MQMVAPAVTFLSGLIGQMFGVKVRAGAQSLSTQIVLTGI